MPVPKTVTKVSKVNGNVAVTYKSNVERVNYTIKELTKAALRDVGKYLVKALSARAPKFTGNLSKAFASEVSKDEKGQYTLKVGVYRKKDDATKHHKKFAPHLHLVLFGHNAYKNGTVVAGNDFVMETVRDNIDTIREIEGQYLSAINDENEALRLAEEAEKASDEE